MKFSFFSSSERGFRLWLRHRHTLPIAILVALCAALWAKVLWGDQVLLPGEMLGGFAPFGSRPNAPWTILQWDGLAQYYPWRLFAARELQAGRIPLWNPHQFSGAPFLANGQSAIFYPLNLPFWIGDVARAFGISAFLHSLLAAISTYFLALRWRLARAEALLSAIAFAFCGYLTAWVTLPTLSNTASWLPLLLLLFERACTTQDKTASQDFAEKSSVARRAAILAVALACALLAGHAQVFLYLVGALILRAFLWPQPRRAFSVLIGGGAGAALLAAAQILPTLELARLGHRAAGGVPSVAGWKAITKHALPPDELISLVISDWPSAWGSVNENFGYSGLSVVVLALIGLVVAGIRPARGFAPQSTLVSDSNPEITPRLAQSRFARWQSDLEENSPLFFCAILTVGGLLYALGWPVARWLYFGVPGLSQMGGVGRALLWWSFGASLLAGFGLNALRRKTRKNPLSRFLVWAPLLVTAELFAANANRAPTAPRQTIYPAMTLTNWLQRHVQPDERIMFLTPRRGWQPREWFRADNTEGRIHPRGVLPPNGATVYGLNDIGGYDSLSPRAYREFLNEREGDPDGVAPQWNGNITLPNNASSSALDALNVHYIVSESGALSAAAGRRRVHSSDGCDVWQRAVAVGSRQSGRDFFPGWHDNRYQPQSFRFGLWISLCALAALSAILSSSRPPKRLKAP